jgi:hypothetical protein
MLSLFVVNPNCLILDQVSRETSRIPSSGPWLPGSTNTRGLLRRLPGGDWWSSFGQSDWSVAGFHLPPFP